MTLCVLLLVVCAFDVEDLSPPPEAPKAMARERGATLEEALARIAALSVKIDALAGVVALARDLLAAGQEGIGLAEVDCDGSALETLDGAGDEVAFLLFELIEEAVALGPSSIAQPTSAPTSSADSRAETRTSPLSTIR